MRLAPALDALLVVLEVIHRIGPAGVLVLAPSHGRAEQAAARCGPSGVDVALMPDMWERAVEGERGWWSGPGRRRGPRSSRLRAAVVLDAHDEAYREERSPTWSAVDVVSNGPGATRRRWCWCLRALR